MVVEGCESDCRASGSVLRSMCYRLDLVEKKTVEGAGSCKTIAFNLKELASAEDRHAKAYQKIQEALQNVPNIKSGNVAPVLKTWHNALMKHAVDTSTTKRRFATSLMTNVVNPLQDHVNQYRNQTRQVFFEMRSSYEVLVTKRNQVAAAKEKYFKACKAADSAIRVRNSTRDKTESEIAAKKNTPTLQHPPLALLEAKRDEVVAGLNLKIQAALDQSSAAKEVYIQADAACQAERLRHESVVADMLRKLDGIEVQREEHVQNQVFFRLAAMYQDMVTCLTATHNALFDESDAAFTAARDGVADFSDDCHSPDDILTYATDQVTTDLDTLAKLSEVFALTQTTFDVHAKRLEQVASSASWALSDLDGELLAHAWDKIQSSVQVFARIHGDFSNAIGGSIPSVWKDLKAAHGHAKKQLASMVQRIVLKRQGVYTNERDATVRFHQAKRELDAKHAQLRAVEREAVDEAKSPDKGIMTLVSLGWKDPANVRLVKLKRVCQEFEETDMAMAAKQLAFAKHATVDFDVQYHAAVAAVHGDFISAQAHVISALAKISSTWRTACRVADTSLDHILHDVFAAIEAIDPIADLTAFVTAMQKTNAMPAPETGKMARLELYTSDLIENETQPPPPAAPVEPGDATKVSSAEFDELGLAHRSLANDIVHLPATNQVEFGVVLFYMCGLLALYAVHQVLGRELAQMQLVVEDYHASIAGLDSMLARID